MIANTNRALIQIGDNTHHQDQLITLVNFSPMNNTVRAPVKLIPPEEEEDEEDIVLDLDCLITFCSMIIKQQVLQRESLPLQAFYCRHTCNNYSTPTHRLECRCKHTLHYQQNTHTY